MQCNVHRGKSPVRCDVYSLQGRALVAQRCGNPLRCRFVGHDASIIASAMSRCGELSFLTLVHPPLPRPFSSGRRKEPKPKLLVRIFSSGVGVFHVNGWGPKSSIRPPKPGKSNFLGGISRDFAGISRRRPKSLRKKSLCSISVPYFLP